MTGQELVEAIARKLRLLYPDRPVYVDELPADAVGNHVVRCIAYARSKQLGRRRTDSYSFEVLYHKADNDGMSFTSWAETLCFELETLEVSDQQIHMNNGQAKLENGNVFHFTVNAGITGLMPSQSGDAMDSIQLVEKLKA